MNTANVSRPSLVALRAFEACRRHGNFSIAASELHQTPSALIHQIKSLESFFGFALLVSQSSHLGLNNQGRRLFKVIEPAFDSIGQICAELRPFPKPKTSGPLFTEFCEQMASRSLQPIQQGLSF
ncbi:MAG: hypothetical protein CML01_21115 [Pseudomonas sp.]|nr:hypothetical protein [Pseudomonas sp.]